MLTYLLHRPLMSSKLDYLIHIYSFLGKAMTRRIRNLLGVTLVLLGVSTLTHAAKLEYEQNQLGGNRYQYLYYMSNEDLNFGIEAFTVFFAADLYQNIEITASPDWWDPLVAEPDPFFGDGYADWYGFGGSVDPGAEVSGFTLEFDWIGDDNGPVEGQFYEIYDVNTFAALDSGISMLRRGDTGGGVTTVPEISASSMSLGFALVMCLLLLVKEIRSSALVVKRFA